MHYLIAMLYWLSPLSLMGCEGKTGPAPTGRHWFCWSGPAGPQGDWSAGSGWPGGPNGRSGALVSTGS